MLEEVLIIITIFSALFILYEFIKIRRILKKNSKFFSTLQKYEMKKISLNPSKELNTLESKLSELQDKVEDQQKTIKKMMTKLS